MDAVNTQYYLIVLVICLLLSAFFSSSETAFISLQRIRLRHLVGSGVAGADRVSRLVSKPEKLLTTILLGNNLVNTAAAALGTGIAIYIFGAERAVLIATVCVTVLLLVFGEIIPKTMATRHTERMALLYVRPMGVVSWLLTPFVTVFGWLGTTVANIGGEPPRKSLVSQEELRTIISLGLEEGAVEKSEAEMLHNVIKFGDRLVKEVMVPRPEIVAIEECITLADFLPIYAESSYSCFPVYHDSIDNIIGVIRVKDILKEQARSTVDGSNSLRSLLRPAYFVPDTKPIGALFAEMQAKKQQMAIVVDEFGGTAGLITLQQLAEEIVGRVGDESMGVKEVETIDEKTFEIDGGMRIDEANEELGLDLPEGDFETVAGFILDVLGHIPQQGEEIKRPNFRLVVKEMKGLRIERVLVTKA